MGRLTGPREVEAALMEVQASGAATALELGPEWQTSFFLPLIFRNEYSSPERGLVRR